MSTSYFEWEPAKKTAARKIRHKTKPSAEEVEQFQERTMARAAAREQERRESTIQEGTRVILSDDAPYTDSPENPKESGLNGCVGTVVHSSYDADEVEVEWDNNRINTYHWNDLINAEEDVAPNHTNWVDDRTNWTNALKDPTKYKGKFEMGTMVYLMPGFFAPHTNNPCLGSKFQCVGEITNASDIGKNKHHVRVAWANGQRNGYSFYDEPGQTNLVKKNDVKALKTLLKDNPNLSFRVQHNHTSGLAISVGDYLKSIMERG